MMRWVDSHIFTIREAPSDADIASHKLLIRSGMIKKLGSGLYSYQNLAIRVIRKIEKIVREELDEIGGVEILMPMVQPRDIWEESGRWEAARDLLLKFKNRNEQWHTLGPTHEEVVTDIARKDIKSYRDLPKILYQIQTKYRDEMRPRFGLLRAREFIMKDAYSFDVDSEKALEAYGKLHKAYIRIFDRLGLQYRVVTADSGAIGGDKSHEFQVLAEAGEDALLVCDHCEFASNAEVAPVVDHYKPIQEPLYKIKKFATKGLKTISDLARSIQCIESDLVKTLFYHGPEKKPVCVLVRGSDEVNPIKLKLTLGMSVEPSLLSHEEVRELTGADSGSCGPVGLNISVYADNALKEMSNFIVGANEDDFHFKNVNRNRDFKLAEDHFADLVMAREGLPCPRCTHGKYVSMKGIEVGHIFYLGTKYSKSMKAFYLNKEGINTPIEMGCYGLGVTRTLQAAIEQSHDNRGIVWPKELSPYDVHICLLDPSDKRALSLVQEIESILKKKGYSVLVDDREERPGVKFNDADLLGFPLRLVIGRRGLEKDEVEVVIRKTNERQCHSMNEVTSFVLNWLS